MTSDPVNDFLMGSGGRSATFKTHGDQVWGTILHSEVRQQTDFDTGALLFWDDGKPRMQLVVTLQTDAQEDADDDGLRRLYVRGQMTKAVQAAVLKAGERGIRDGGRLFVRYVSDEEPKRKGMSGAKQYIAKYDPPVTVVPVDDDQPDPDDIPF